jgi:lipoyl(octanoyl) transferase
MHGMDVPCPAPPLAKLQLWDDRATPHSGVMNMAMDEAMLELAAAKQSAILRAYRWQEPTLSFGYFLSVAEARAALRPGEAMIRRWTGGGLVHHEDAVTWSLAVPRDSPFCQERPAVSYAKLHKAVARVLTSSGWDQVSVVPADWKAPTGGLCAEAPAPGDVLWQGRKIAGAGQRRTHKGLLHQGVLFVPDTRLPADFPLQLARDLAAEVQPFPLGEIPRELPTRYAAEHWNEGKSSRQTAAAGSAP